MGPGQPSWLAERRDPPHFRQMTDIPILETSRLTLRALQPSDADAYCAMMADPDVTRFLGDGRPLTRPDAWRQMAMILGHWALRGFGLWAVEERATGTFIGRVGCFQPDGWPDFEIGYVLARDAWGKGYASEAAAASLAYARTVLGRERIISIIRPDNLGSIRVASGLGAVPEGFVEFFGAPALVYAYPSPGVPAVAPAPPIG